MSHRRPGDRLQASWLRPSSSGRLASLGLSLSTSSPFSPVPPPPTSARTSVCSGTWRPACPREALSLDAHSFGPQSSPVGVGPQGHPSSKSPSGSGASPPGPHALPSSLQLFTLTAQPEPLGRSGPDVWRSRPAAAPQWGWLAGGLLPAVGTRSCTQPRRV